MSPDHHAHEAADSPAIEHAVEAIPQRTSECLQTAATQMLSFFEPAVTVDEVLAAVPVYVDENGEKIGTSPGHLAAFFAARGYGTTAHLFDVELFDRSWRDAAVSEVVDGLRARQPHIPDNAWLAAYHHILVEGWSLFAEAGGRFAFPPLSKALLADLLQSGPCMIILNSTYLNQRAKQKYNLETDTFDDDPVGGRSLTHAVTAVGVTGDDFVILDPDPPAGEPQRRVIHRDHLLASIMAAQTESDNLLITIER